MIFRECTNGLGRREWVPNITFDRQLVIKTLLHLRQTQILDPVELLLLCRNDDPGAAAAAAANL
jgi:hypothetical protein